MVTTHLLYVEERLGHEPMFPFPFLYGEIRKISRTKEIYPSKIQISKPRTIAGKKTYIRGSLVTLSEQSLESILKRAMNECGRRLHLELKLLKVHSSRARTHSRKQCWRIVEKGGYFSNYDQKLESVGEEEMHA